MKLARTSLALLAIQLGLVSSIAARYLVDRKTNPPRLDPGRRLRS